MLKLLEKLQELLCQMFKKMHLKELEQFQKTTGKFSLEARGNSLIYSEASGQV